MTSPAESTVVAIYVSHGDGQIAALITGPGFDSKVFFTDLYEVDMTAVAFADEEEGWAWLKIQIDTPPDSYTTVDGGYIYAIDCDGERDEL